MKQLFTFLISSLMVVQTFAQNSTVVAWAGNIGGPYTDVGNGICVDGDRNVFVTGGFQSSMDLALEGDPVILNGITGLEAYLAKYNSSGELLWYTSFGGQLDSVGAHVDTDATGNVYSTGKFNRTVDFDPGPNTFNLTVDPPSPYSNSDIYISKLDANGDFLWAQRIGGDLAKYPTDFKVDASGHIYMTGYFNGTTTFESGLTFTPSEVEGIVNTRFDMFICKLDSNGTLLWAKQLGTGTVSQHPKGLSFDSAGNVYVNGNFNDTTDFDPGPEEYILEPTVEGQSNAFVLKLDSNGDFVWVREIKGTNGVFSTNMAVKDDHLVVTGSFTQTVDFDPGVGTHMVEGDINASKPFILQLSTAGDFEWVNTIEGNGNAERVIFKADGSLVVSGEFYNDMTFDINEQPEVFTSQGYSDLFVANYTSEGDPVWVKQLGGTEMINMALLDSDSQGDVYAFGGFKGAATINNNVDNYTLTSDGYSDMYLFRITEESLSTKDFEDTIFSVYPNPFDKEVNFKFPDYLKGSKLTIYSSIGQEVLSTTLQKNLDVSHLSEGVYLLKVTGATQSFNYKLVKRN